MTDDDLRALQESAQLLTELTSHPGWKELHGLVIEKMRPETTRLLNGRANTFEEYHHQTGKLVGMQDVIDIPKSIFSMLNNELVRRAERSAADES